jgi:hypothetical protein
LFPNPIITCFTCEQLENIFLKKKKLQAVSACSIPAAVPTSGISLLLLIVFGEYLLKDSMLATHYGSERDDDQDDRLMGCDGIDLSWFRCCDES